MALSVGLWGRNEVADVGLSHWMRPLEFRTRLQAELPKGIAVASVQITRTRPGRQPKELSYRVPLLPGHSLTPDRLQELLDADQVTVSRPHKDGTRDVEVRQFVKAVRLEGQAVQMLLRYADSGTARPEEIMEALGCRQGTDYRKSDIERTHVNLVPPR
jgi:radical SAM-linked protein